jgi:hypothetical protein
MSGELPSSFEGSILIERQLRASEITSEALLALLDHDDPLGVLSIYIDATASADTGAVAIAAKNALGQARRAAPSRVVAQALDGTLARLAPTLERLVGPAGLGCGHALFASLSTPEATLFASRLRVPNQATVDSAPVIHPLLEVVDAGRPAGVILINGGSADLLDWRLGQPRRIAHVRPSAPLLRAERPGPVAVHPGRGQQSTPMREQRQRRLRAHRQQLVEDVAARALELTRSRAWERLLVAGDERVARELFSALPRELRAMATLEGRHLAELEGHGLELALARRLDAARAARDVALVSRVLHAGNRSALGLEAVLDALNDARVEHLLYDSRTQFRGASGNDGALFTRGGAAGATHAEPRLIERVVERCLRTAARITPVAPPAAGALADADGIAALLRW